MRYDQKGAFFIQVTRQIRDRFYVYTNSHRIYFYLRFFQIFEKYGGFKSGQLKLKKPNQLQEILDISRFLLSEISSNPDPEIEEKKSKLEQLKAVLEM